MRSAQNLKSIYLLIIIEMLQFNEDLIEDMKYVDSVLIQREFRNSSKHLRRTYALFG